MLIPPVSIQRIVSVLVLVLFVVGAAPTAIAQDGDPPAVEPSASVKYVRADGGGMATATVNSRGPDVQAAEAAAHDAAVRRALKDLVTDATFSTPRWADAVKAHAKTKDLKKTVIDGGVELELTIEINVDELLARAEAAGTRVKVNLPSLAFATAAEVAKTGDATPDELLARAVAMEELGKKGMQLFDYQMAMQAGGLGATKLVRMQVTASGEPGNTVKVRVEFTCVDASTAQMLATASEWSPSIAAGQKAAAVRIAASKAANSLYRSLVQHYARQAQRGVMFRVHLTGVPAARRNAVVDALVTISHTGRLSSLRNSDGVVSCVLPAAPGADIREVRRNLHRAMAAVGFKLVNERLEGQAYSGELQPDNG